MCIQVVDKGENFGNVYGYLRQSVPKAMKVNDSNSIL